MASAGDGRRGSIRQEPNGTWMFVLDTTPPGSKQRAQTRRRGFRTKREAQAALNDAVAALSAKTYVPPSRQLLGVFLSDSWLAAVETRLRRGTWESYRRMIRLHVRPHHIADVYLQAIDPGMLNAFYADLLAAREGTRPLAPRTVQYIHSIVHRGLRDAVRWGLIPRNPAASADPPRPQASDRRAIGTWTAEQLRRFLAETSTEELGALWHLYATTGCRRGELLGLRWRDVDLAHGRLAIVRTLVEVEPHGDDQVSWQFGEPKTSRGRRSMALDAHTIALLKAHRKLQIQERMKLRNVWQDYDLVFCRADGSPLHPKTVSTRFVDTAERIGMPHLSLHGLRHTWATLALGGNVHPRVVQERLGHSSVGVTLDIYSHVTPAMQSKAAEQVAALIYGEGQ